MSEGGDQWNKWKDWVPGDPVPGELAPDQPTRRPARQVPPPPPGQGASPSPSPSAGPVGARVPPASGRGLVLVLAVVVALAGAGGALFLASSTTTSPAPPVVVDGDPVGVPAPPGDVGAPSSPAGEGRLDLLGHDLRPALDILQAEVGGEFRVQQFVIYPAYLVARIEPPALVGEIDSWTVYPSATVSGPTAQSNPGEVEPSLFGVDELDLAVLASLPRRAEVELALPDATAAYAIVERDRWHDGIITVRVYVRSERRAGSVTFAVAGEVLDVHRG